MTHIDANANPTNDTNCNCHMSQRTYSTNHMCLRISHHIMPLVINSLEGGHTYTHIHTGSTMTACI